MNVISVNAESKLINLASTISRSPQSWYGWCCLKILLDKLDRDQQHESLFLVKSLISSYLKGSQGTVFFCENDSIHIIVNSVQPEILEYAGQQICELSQHENEAPLSYTIYDLAQCGEYYAQGVINHLNGLAPLEDAEFLNDTSATASLMCEPEQGTIKNKQPNVGKTKVLLVEDDPVTRWLVRQTLKNDCEFTTAQTANKAFNLYSSYQPDVVFLDINLPDKSGYEVLEWIIRNDPGANVVMFSSQNNIKSIEDAIDMGASGFIGKPFVKQQLFSYIQGQA